MMQHKRPRLMHMASRDLEMSHIVKVYAVYAASARMVMIKPANGIAKVKINAYHLLS